MLALVMVFTTVVSAFAAETEGPIGEPEKETTVKINFSASKNGKFDGVTQDATLYVAKTGKDGRDFTKVADATTENGKGFFEVKKDDILPNAEYFIVVGGLSPDTNDADFRDAELVAPGTTWKYVLTTDADKKFVNLKEDYHFDLYVEPKAGSDFTVISLDENAKTAPNVKFGIYKVKVNDDQTAYISDKNGSYVYDKEGLLDTYTTDEFGEKGFSTADLADLATKAGYDIDGTTVVGFVLNGELVAVADIHENSKDSLVYLRPVPVVTKLVVTVEGNDRMVDIDGEEALKPIKGATVELQANTTKYHGAEEYGKVLDTKTTDAEGKAVFTNPEISRVVRVLDSSLNSEDKATGYWTNILLFNRVAVVKADGYRVPRTASLSTIKTDDNGVMHITFTLLPEGGIYTHRVKGDNRYETSVNVAKKAFKGDQENVLLASGDVYADALVANGLVGLKDQPLVLNGKDKLDPAVKQYLKDVKAKHVTIVGGDSVISGAVQGELEELGLTIERISGANRYETSVKVLQHFVKGGEIKEGNTSKIFLASGEDFADALVASVPAAMYARPILLTQKDQLPTVVREAIENDKYNVQEVTVVGGAGTVSDDVYSRITISNVQRLKGQNRQLTAMAVADEYFMNAGQAIIVDGTKSKDSFADALSAGQLAWKLKAPILLTESKTVLGKDLAEYLRTNNMTEITLVGGAASVSEGIKKQLEEILAGK